MPTSHDHTTSSDPYGARSERSSASPTAWLSPADVREFQALLRTECGIDLSDTDAWTRATELVALYRMLLSPVPEDTAAPALTTGFEDQPLWSSPPSRYHSQTPHQ